MSDTSLSNLQLASLLLYSNGDHAHLANLKEDDAIDQAKNHIGDTLLGFVLAEMSDAGDNVSEGIEMLRRAARQLEEIADGLEQNDHWTKMSDIVWDADGENVDHLPTTVVVTEVEQDDPEYKAAGWLSDKFGWCVSSLKVEEISLKESLTSEV